MSKGEKTRQFIIEKTAPIFNMKGYAGTSLSDMTQATGLTKGSIYGNFKDKDEVACAVFDHNLKAIGVRVSREMDKESSAREKLLAYVRVYDHYLENPFPVGGCPILNTAIEADDTHPVLREKALGAVMRWKDRIVGLIRSGIDSGEFSIEVNPEQVALTLIAMIEGAVMISKLTGKISHRKAVLHSVEKIIRELD